MSVSGSFGYYDIVRYTAMLLLLAAAVAVLIRGRLQGTLLLAVALASATALLAASFYNAWTADYQAQGRYMLPLLGMFGVLCWHQKEAIKELPVALLICAMYALSLYSFIFVGLAGIGKIGYPIG